jgi:hypothetical protein
MSKPYLYWLLLIFFLTPSASSHEVKPALLTLAKQDDQHWTAVFKQPLINGRFLNLQLDTNCQLELLDTIVAETAMQESFTLLCEPSPLESIAVEGLNATLIDVMVKVDKPGQKTANHLLSASNPRLDLSAGAIAVPVYFRLGIAHLLFGFDHVLFVLLLLFLIHGWKALLGVITSFTFAHSITLGLSSLNYFSLSQGPIEALIALSIVLLAREILFPSQSILQAHPWLVSFLFGLLHGFGFAGALTEIGLPAEAMVITLLLFNLGIEVGQIIIVAMALSVILVFNRTGLTIHRYTLNLPVYIAGGIAIYWFGERSLSILLN